MKYQTYLGPDIEVYPLAIRPSIHTMTKIFACEQEGPNGKIRVKCELRHFPRLGDAIIKYADGRQYLIPLELLEQVYINGEGYAERYGDSA